MGTYYNTPTRAIEYAKTNIFNNEDSYSACGTHSDSSWACLYIPNMYSIIHLHYKLYIAYINRWIYIPTISNAGVVMEINNKGYNRYHVFTSNSNFYTSPNSIPWGTGIWYSVDIISNTTGFWFYINKVLQISSGSSMDLQTIVMIKGTPDQNSGCYIDDILITVDDTLHEESTDGTYHLQRELTPYESFTDKENNIYGNI